ncbi:hypothetical protein AVEN_272101-1 [Araneus ventricosus]|uniref:Uncharacterized protein n=1 Tax=Araneus ventricosus TaxID=182803 RepID=A0A4Y2PDG7_ARAVE|nr:hypothetical protein AVEN_272101-1 [Araneus ventricosus]
MAVEVSQQELKIAVATAVHTIDSKVCSRVMDGFQNRFIAVLVKEGDCEDLDQSGLGDEGVDQVGLGEEVLDQLVFGVGNPLGWVLDVIFAECDDIRAFCEPRVKGGVEP